MRAARRKKGLQQIGFGESLAPHRQTPTLTSRSIQVRGSLPPSRLLEACASAKHAADSHALDTRNERNPLPSRLVADVGV